MSTHLVRLESDENHHYAFSASPTVMMIIMTTHLLRLQPGLTGQLELFQEDKDDDKEDGHDEHHDDDADENEWI